MILNFQILYFIIYLNFHIQAKKHLSGSDRVQQSESLEYGSYDTGDDHNLVFYDKPAPGKVLFVPAKIPHDLSQIKQPFMSTAKNCGGYPF